MDNQLKEVVQNYGTGTIAEMLDGTLLDYASACIHDAATGNNEMDLTRAKERLDVLRRLRDAFNKAE